jgi:hypothetical protein
MATFINGVRLPEDFQAGSIVNNLAVSRDGKRYALVSNGSILMGDMPASGKLTVEGLTSPSSRAPASASRPAAAPAAAARIGSSAPRAYEKVDCVRVESGVGDITLGLSDDRKVHVEGDTGSERDSKDGDLRIEDLDGALLLPKGEAIDLGVRTGTGDISGEVESAGRFVTGSGDITLTVRKPFKVVARVSTGSVDVRGMLSEGDGVFLPPDGKFWGVLEAKTSTGDISIRYAPN